MQNSGEAAFPATGVEYPPVTQVAEVLKDELYVINARVYG